MSNHPEESPLAAAPDLPLCAPPLGGAPGSGTAPSTTHSTDRTHPSPSALLAERHAALLEALWSLMEALVGLDLNAASEQLFRLREALLAHAKAEDDGLLAAYYARVSPSPRGATREIIEREHYRIEAGLADARARLDAVLETPSRRAVLELLFLLRLLKELLEHHFQREETIVMAALEVCCDDETLRRWIRALPPIGQGSDG